MKITKTKTRTVYLTAEEVRQIIANYINAAASDLCAHPDNVVVRNSYTTGVGSGSATVEIDNMQGNDREFVVTHAATAHEVKGTG